MSATTLRKAVINGELWLEMQMTSGPMAGRKYYACKVRHPNIGAVLLLSLDLIPLHLRLFICV
jgi:hypothetical protein